MPSRGAQVTLHDGVGFLLALSKILRVHSVSPTVLLLVSMASTEPVGGVVVSTVDRR